MTSTGADTRSGPETGAAATDASARDLLAELDQAIDEAGDIVLHAHRPDCECPDCRYGRRISSMTLHGLIGAITRHVVTAQAARCLTLLRQARARRVRPASPALLRAITRINERAAFLAFLHRVTRPGRYRCPAHPLVRARAVLTAAPPLSRASGQRGAAM